MKKKVLIALVAAIAIVVGSAAPAFAVTVDGTNWSLNSTSSFGVSQVGSTQNTAPFGAYSGDGIYLQIEDPNNAGSYFDFNCGGSQQTVQADGDVLVECLVPGTLYGGDLVWDTDLTIFSGDYHGLVGRFVYTMSNASASDLTLNLSFLADTEECDGGVGNIATSNGDFDTTTADAWLLCNNDNKAIEGFAWGNNWMTLFESDDSINACDVCKFKNNSYVLPAGASRTFVFFVYTEGSTDHGASFGDTDANIIANAIAYFDPNTIGSSRLWENLTAADNWTSQGGSESSEAALPNTGVDVGGLLLGALALAGLGTVIVMRRRAAKA